VLNAYGDQIIVCRLPASVGFAAACNAGAAATDSELIVFLNNDTRPWSGWLAALRRCAESRQEAAIFGAKLLWPDNVVQHAGIVITAPGWPHSVYRGFPSDHPAVNRSRPMRAVTGACMLVRRDMFNRVGGFDTAFMNGYEDVDLCLRVGVLGAETYYCAESVVYHLESASRATVKEEAGEDANLKLLLDRWKDRTPPNDLLTYVSDGVIELQYTGQPHPIGMKVDPCLASVTFAEADNTLQRLLNVRTRQVFELLLELGWDAPRVPSR
jgi:hypothetical protein